MLIHSLTLVFGEQTGQACENACLQQLLGRPRILHVNRILYPVTVEGD
jgi:hypothetical protein